MTDLTDRIHEAMTDRIAAAGDSFDITDPNWVSTLATTAARAAATSIDPTSAMRALIDAHDELVDTLGGEPYVAVTASWRANDDAPLTMLSYSTIDPDEEDDVSHLPPTPRSPSSMSRTPAPRTSASSRSAATSTAAAGPGSSR